MLITGGGEEHTATVAAACARLSPVWQASLSVGERGGRAREGEHPEIEKASDLKLHRGLLRERTRGQRRFYSSELSSGKWRELRPTRKGRSRGRRAQERRAGRRLFDFTRSNREGIPIPSTRGTQSSTEKIGNRPRESGPLNT